MVRSAPSGHDARSRFGAGSSRPAGPAGSRCWHPSPSTRLGPEYGQRVHHLKLWARDKRDQTLITFCFIIRWRSFKDDKLTAAWWDNNGSGSHRSPPSPPRCRVWFCGHDRVFMIYHIKTLINSHTLSEPREKSPSQHSDLVLQIEVFFLFLLHALHGKQLSRLLLLHHEHLGERPPGQQDTTWLIQSRLWVN